MGYQSKTYSLSDEVVERLESEKAAGRTPNQFLLALITLYDAHDGNGCYVVQSPSREVVQPFNREPQTTFRDASVPAGARTLPSKMVEQPRPHTMHSGVRPVPGCKVCEGMK